MTPDWTPLDAELAHWKQDDLPLWWRDDDAIEPTTALAKLAVVSQRVGLPVHLAIIPAHVRDTLADVVDGQTLIPVVHGWSHRNHAPQSQKKSEFGATRPLEIRANEASVSLARLTNLFGTALQPMFVPPWNRIAPDMTGKLAALGYTSLSTFTPRTTPDAAPGLAQINTHLDPIDWHNTRSLIDPDALIAQVTRQLCDRRTGKADATEPYGILTHHLVHDAAIWTFTEQLILRLMNGPAYAWTDQKQGPIT